MEKIDYFYLSNTTHNDLLKSFYDLYHTEKMKLNGFLVSKEFALTHFFVRIFGKELGYSLSFEYSYNKYKDRVIACCDEYGFQVEGTGTRITIEERFLSNDHIGGLKTNMSIGYEDKKRKQLLYEALADQGRDIKSFSHDLIILFFAINLVLMALPEKVEQKEEKDSRTIEVKKKGGGKTYKSVVYIKRIHSFGENFKLTKSDIKHIIKCPAWGVRGHKRHLSDGRVIYIKPYVKGKYRNDANKYVAKEYRLDIE